MMRRPAIRVLAWSVALVLVALPVVGVLQGWFAVDRWPIRNLQVQAEYRHVSAAQIRAAIVPRIRRGFFATNLEAVQQAVAALPWVRSAEARKRWPDTLVVRVYERQPFAHWNGTHLISREGRLFDVPNGDAVAGLPRLSGPDPRLADVVAFFTEAGKTFAGTGLQLEGVHLSGRGSWSLDLKGGATVMIGEAHPRQRLQRFLDVYRHLMVGRSDRFAYADLRYPNGFAVRWPPPVAIAPGGAPSS